MQDIHLSTKDPDILLLLLRIIFYILARNCQFQYHMPKEVGINYSMNRFLHNGKSTFQCTSNEREKDLNMVTTLRQQTLQFHILKFK